MRSYERGYRRIEPKSDLRREAKLVRQAKALLDHLSAYGRETYGEGWGGQSPRLSRVWTKAYRRWCYRKWLYTVAKYGGTAYDHWSFDYGWYSWPVDDKWL